MKARGFTALPFQDFVSVLSAALLYGGSLPPESREFAERIHRGVRSMAEAYDAEHAFLSSLAPTLQGESRVPDK